MSLLSSSKLALLFTYIVLATGCAVSSVFNPYPNQAQEFRNAIGSTATAENQSASELILAELNEDRESADKMLYMMERGRIAQLSDKFDDSKTDFQVVIDGFEEQDLAATIEVSDLGAQSASLLTNDNAIPYKGSGYERIFLHHQQALNYWGNGDIQGAAVEFRKVALEQQVLAQKYEQDIAEAAEEAEENQVDVDTLSQEFAGLDVIAGQVKSSFQNAYTFYHSAAFWEATGEYNNALVDYKKALEINPESEMIKQDVARVSKKVGISGEFPDTNAAQSDEGTVVILYEDGFIPAKTEFKLSVPNFTDGGVITVAMPYYDVNLWPQSSPLSILDDQFTDFGHTDHLVDFGALAVKDLKEQFPKLVMRQILRGFAKYELQKQSADHLGFAGQLAANIYNIVSESADRRSWLTLPSTGQAKRINLKEGKRELTLRTANAVEKLELEVQAETTTFVRVVHANNRLLTQVYTL